MFANLGAFINGTGTYGPAERPMGGWISLPPTWSAHPPLAREWVERALAESAELPAKAPKR